MRFAERNESAMRDMKGTADFIDRTDAFSHLLRPEDSVAGRLKSRLALDALFIGNAREQNFGRARIPTPGCRPADGRRAREIVRDGGKPAN